jgi:hypothetical protein
MDMQTPNGSYHPLKYSLPSMYLLRCIFAVSLTHLPARARSLPPTHSPSLPPSLILSLSLSRSLARSIYPSDHPSIQPCLVSSSRSLAPSPSSPPHTIPPTLPRMYARTLPESSTLGFVLPYLRDPLTLLRWTLNIS